MKRAARALGRVSLALFLASLGCTREGDTVFHPLVVQFARAESAVEEGEESPALELTLNAPASEEVKVTLALVDEGASGHDECDGRDYSLTTKEVVFAPGEQSALVELRVLNDDLPEGDERVRLEIESVEGARVGESSTHVHTIIDDDRQLLLDVRLDFAATGDGQTDDTTALQSAIDRAAGTNGAVVSFPPGDYRITELELAPGVTYVGDAARLILAPGQSTDAEMVVLAHAGGSDSETTVLQGLTFDGARSEQGDFSDWQFQSSILLSVYGDPSEQGRVALVGQDLRFQSSGGSGVVLGTNSDATLCRIEGRDVFTDLLKVSGGHSSLKVAHLRGEGSVGTTGIAFTGLLPGYAGSQAIEAELQGLDLITGDLEIDVQEGANVVAREVRMGSPPLYLRAVRSQIQISDSVLQVGPPRFRANRIVAPSDVLIENTEIIVRKISDPHATQPEEESLFSGLWVTWDDVDYAYFEGEEDQLVESLEDQTLTVRASTFTLGDDVEAEDTVYAAGSFVAPEGGGHALIFDEVEVGPGLAGVFEPGCGACQSVP